MNETDSKNNKVSIFADKYIYIYYLTILIVINPIFSFVIPKIHVWNLNVFVAGIIAVKIYKSDTAKIKEILTKLSDIMVPKKTEKVAGCIFPCATIVLFLLFAIYSMKNPEVTQSSSWEFVNDLLTPMLLIPGLITSAIVNIIYRLKKSHSKQKIS